MALISLFLLLVAKVYPILADLVGLYSCFWFFSVVCVLGLLFTIFILPETTGKNINDVNLTPVPVQQVKTISRA